MGYLEQALGALAHLPADRTTREQAIDLRCELYRSLLPLGQCQQALTYLRDAERLAHGLADQRRLAWVYHRLSIVLRQLHDLEPALAYCQRAHATATALGDRALQVWVNLDMGMISCDLGDYRRAIASLQQVLTAPHGEWHDPSLGDVSLPAVAARTWLVQCLSRVGEFAAGVAYGAEALQIVEAVNQPYERQSIYSRVGDLHVSQGALHTAIPLLEQGLGMSQDADRSPFYYGIVSYLAHAYALTDRVPEALALLEQVRGKAHYNLPLLLTWGDTYLRAGEVQEAARLAQQVLADVRQRNMRGSEARARWLLGEVARHADPPDVTPAAAHYQQALALATELGMRPLVAHCHLGLGTLYATTGRREQSRTALAAAINLYRAMEMTFWLPQAEAALAQVEG